MAFLVIFSPALSLASSYSMCIDINGLVSFSTIQESVESLNLITAKSVNGSGVN